MLSVEGHDVIECANPYHYKNISPYHRKRVPRLMFLKKDGSLYRTCSDCRVYDRQIRRGVRKRRREEAEKAGPDDLYRCVTCGDLRIKECCVNCETRNRLCIPDRIAAYDRVIVERIREVDACCEVCRKVFLKTTDGSHGFIVVDSLDGIDTNMLELRNLEFDHLDESEQMARFGKIIGPKKKGVGQEGSYAAQKAESEKCQLICLFCHLITTKRRRQERRPSAHPKYVNEKKAYVDAEKLRLGGCEWCGHFDPSNLTYYEFDHVDPKIKRDTITTIAARGTKSGNTMGYLKDEIARCRLLCRFCHRKRTAEQHAERHAQKRVVGYEKLKRVMTPASAGEDEDIVDKILRELDEMAQ